MGQRLLYWCFFSAHYIAVTRLPPIFRLRSKTFWVFLSSHTTSPPLSLLAPSFLPLRLDPAYGATCAPSGIRPHNTCYWLMIPAALALSTMFLYIVLCCEFLSYLPTLPLSPFSFSFPARSRLPSWLQPRPRSYRCSYFHTWGLICSQRPRAGTGPCNCTCCLPASVSIRLQR